MTGARLAVTLAAVVLAVATTFGLGAPSDSQATFVASQPNDLNAFTTATLQPPTALAASPGPAADEITLNWTASASPFGDGYRVYRSTTQGCCYALVNSVLGRLTTTYLDSGLAAVTTYYYALRAYFQNWESIDSNEASATTS